MDATLVNPPVVLLVDDDTRTAKRLARMLEEDGYFVEVAADGVAAIRRLEQSLPPDVLVTDLRMPNANGATVALFARSRKADLPVIIVTGYPDLAASLERLGFSPPAIVMTKPFEYDELREEIGRQVGRHS